MASVARVIDASLDRMEAVMDTPVLDEHGGDIPLDHYDIELAHVSFAYGQENVLQDVSAVSYTHLDVYKRQVYHRQP